MMGDKVEHAERWRSRVPIARSPDPIESPEEAAALARSVFRSSSKQQQAAAAEVCASFVLRAN